MAAEPQSPRRGDPSKPKVGRLDQLVAIQFKNARKSRFWTVAELHRRVPVSLTYIRLTRFENLQVSLEIETLEALATLLDLRLEAVLAEARRLLKVEQAIGHERTVKVPVVELPGIRVNIEHLLARKLPWATRVGGMLRVHLEVQGDEQGDVLIEEPLVRAIAAQAELEPLELWRQMARSILSQEDSDPEALLTGGRRAAARYGVSRASR